MFADKYSIMARFSLMVLLMLSSALLSWQAPMAQKPVNGKVLSSSNNQPVSGASVMVKGKTVGVSTNVEGMFSVAASEGDVLTISGVGIRTFEHKVAGSGLQVITVEVEPSRLDEVVVTALGIKKDRKKLG